MKETLVYEDNAGGLYIVTTDDYGIIKRAHSDLEMVDHAEALNDIIAHHDNDIDDWTLPVVKKWKGEHTYYMDPDLKLVAYFGGDEITLRICNMGHSAKRYFGISIE